MTAAALPSPAGRERAGVALCLLAALSFAAMVVVAKLAYADGANVVTLLAVRFSIAAPVLWLLAAHRGVARIASARDGLVALGLGLAVYSAETVLAFGALTRLDASLVELLLFSYPAIVVLAAIALRHERASRRRLIALGLATSGVALVLLGSAAGALDPLGTALALGAAVLYASYVLIAATLGGRLHPLTLAALVCTGTAIALTGAGAATGSLRLEMGTAAWGWAVGIALVATVVGITAFLAGVERLGASRSSILATFEPAFACGLAFLIFGERLTPLQLGGGALVVAGAIVLQLRPLRSRRRGAPARTADRPAAGALAPATADGRGLGVRAEVRRLPRARVRRREHGRDPVARR